MHNPTTVAIRLKHIMFLYLFTIGTNVVKHFRELLQRNRNLKQEQNEEFLSSVSTELIVFKDTVHNSYGQVVNGNVGTKCWEKGLSKATILWFSPRVFSPGT